MTHTDDLIAWLRGRQTCTGFKSGEDEHGGFIEAVHAPCQKSNEAADALTAAQERIEALEDALQNALASGLPDVVADSARAALDATGKGEG